MTGKCTLRNETHYCLAEEAWLLQSSLKTLLAVFLSRKVACFPFRSCLYLAFYILCHTFKSNEYFKFYLAEHDLSILFWMLPGQLKCSPWYTMFSTSHLFGWLIWWRSELDSLCLSGYILSLFGKGDHLSLLHIGCLDCVWSTYASPLLVDGMNCC